MLRPCKCTDMVEVTAPYRELYRSIIIIRPAQETQCACYRINSGVSGRPDVTGTGQDQEELQDVDARARAHFTCVKEDMSFFYIKIYITN